tara:strand:- start:113 stop:637 length:525 start_codon:yes stop_codon:yes gene_type:complete
MAKLTPKRRHFARLVASGQSQAEAYREAFDCKPGSLSKTHVESASKLCRDPNVATTIRQLIDARDRAQRDRGLSKRDLVISKLSDAMEDNDYGVNRLKAISLMIDCLGMRRHSLDVTQNDNRSSESIMADLEAKLSALGLTDKEETMDHQNIIDHDQDMDTEVVINNDDDTTRH